MTARADRIAALVAMLFAALAVARITSTYTRFSQTYDEPAHISVGMEWLDRGTYTLEVQHPPLSRIAVAIGPWLTGSRFPNVDPHGVPVGFLPTAVGNEILFGNGAYERTLALARLGNLPLFLLATVIVWSWTRRLAGAPSAAIAVGLFTMLPPVLAHASLATTDMSITATYVTALFAFTRWLESPSMKSATLFALALGLALASKLSAIPFLGLAIVAILIARAAMRIPTPFASLAKQSLPVVGAALATLWGFYRFDVGPVIFTGLDSTYMTLSIAPHGGMKRRIVAWLFSLRHAPAPQYIVGILHLMWHEVHGHRSYLLGMHQRDGVWYYFPTVLALKTPLAFTLLAIAAAIFTMRLAPRERRLDFALPLIGAASILLIAMAARINIGVRHVLPMYPLLAIFTAPYIAQLRSRIVVIALCAWLVVASAIAHPDYLASFSELALFAPKPPLVDSDLDWGQDLPRLREAVARRHIRDISIAYFGTTDLNRYFIAPGAGPLPPRTPTPGWIAISRTRLAAVYDAPDAYTWLAHETPVEEVGKSMLLYYVSH